MVSIPGLSEALIRQHAPGELLSRGRSYVISGAVAGLAVRGSVFEASVEGSAAQPYRVRVFFDAGGVTAAACTCPDARFSWCKHIAAALLAALEHPDEIVERPPVSALLAPLDRGQLQWLLERLATRQPALTEAIEQELALLRPAAAVAEKPAPPARHTPVDAEPLRRQVRALLNPRSRDYDDYRYSETVAGGMHQIVAQVRSFLDSGDGANALRLLDGVTDEYARGWYNFDQEGELGYILDDLGELWAEALLSPGASDEDREAWAHRLAEWADEADAYGSGDGLRMAERAALQGWDAPTIVAALQGAQPLPIAMLDASSAQHTDDDDGDEVDDEEPYNEDDEPYDEGDDAYKEEPIDGGYVAEGLPTPAERLVAIRLRVLEREGRTDEYLNFAAASGRASERALMLVRLGRNDEAVATAMRDLVRASEALALATALRERGALDAALRVGAHGLALTEPRAALGSWLATLAASLGHSELALHAAEVAFRSEPSLARYQTLRDLTGAGWEKLRGGLLAFLRDEQTGWRWRAAAIDIFLHEDLIDDAIQAVGSGGYGDLARVMDAATALRPDWVITAATQQAARIVDAGKAQRYDDAIEWLRRARASYRTSGHVEGWKTYLDDLRARHGRKYKLMGLIEQLEAGA